MTDKYKFVFTCFMLIGMLQSFAQTQEEISEIIIKKLTPELFKEKSTDQVILDVRSSEEFDKEHLEGAININVRDENFLKNVEGFDKSKAIFVYCRSGKRSHLATTKLLDLGFENIYDLEGGILNWIKNEYKTVPKTGQ